VASSPGGVVPGGIVPSGCLLGIYSAFAGYYFGLARFDPLEAGTS
jgi:hypothetical protein